ncbi:MAG TPA: hypothetical protein VFX59_07060 [Polyangiales bacterium]|nr:hypothetical protein [Polyangiales bacterium]
MDDRPRKDRLIQTRVPQDLESTLKDEARKRRLSVSHLIRNVLEDTFSLVDNVVSEVDRVVTDSVEMVATVKRDAARLAATARGHTSHREPRRREAEVIDVEGSEIPEPAVPKPPLASGPLADVYGFQELVLNRAASCANCATEIPRGSRAYLGMTDRPELPRVWVCQDCLDTISR